MSERGELSYSVPYMLSSNDLFECISSSKCNVAWPAQHFTMIATNIYTKVTPAVRYSMYCTYMYTS